MLQTLVVALLVVGCAVYATWTLLPRAAARHRRAAAEAAAARRRRRFLRRHAAAASGCGCDGCDRNARPAAGARFLRKARRSSSTPVARADSRAIAAGLSRERRAHRLVAQALGQREVHRLDRPRQAAHRDRAERAQPLDTSAPALRAPTLRR